MGISRSTERLALSLAEESKIEKMKGERKHVHDELIIECRKDASLDAICEQMGRTPPWIKGLLLRADGYECDFYQKD